MSRVAVRPSNGDDIEKIVPVLLAGAKALGGAALRGAAKVAGKTALGQGFTAARGGTGIMEMYTRMQTKRLKIFKNQDKLLQELRMYHRKDGKIVAINDDVISAMRYAVMSLRKARVKDYQPAYIQADTEFNVFA